MSLHVNRKIYDHGKVIKEFDGDHTDEVNVDAVHWLMDEAKNHPEIVAKLNSEEITICGCSYDDENETLTTKASATMKVVPNKLRYKLCNCAN